MHPYSFLQLIISALATIPVVPLSDAAVIGENEIMSRDEQISYYYLKTTTINGGSPDHNNLYVNSYHTGAGLSDATLGDKDKAVAGFLNDTVQQFNITTGFPWSFFLPQATTYDAWYPVRLNAGLYTSQLFFNATGLQWTDYESFGGWLACDWSHGVPQLFWKVNYINYPLEVCSQVDLYAEYIYEEDD